MGNCIALKSQIKTCCADVDVHHPIKIKQMSVREIIKSKSGSRDDDGLPPPPERQQLLEKDEIIEEPADTSKVIFTISDGDSDEEFGLNYDSDFSVDSNEFSEIELGNM